MSTSHANHVAECLVECYCETRHIRIFIDSDIRRERGGGGREKDILCTCLFYYYYYCTIDFQERVKKKGEGSLYTANEQQQNFYKT